MVEPWPVRWKAVDLSAVLTIVYRMTKSVLMFEENNYSNHFLDKLSIHTHISFGLPKDDH